MASTLPRTTIGRPETLALSRYEARGLLPACAAAAHHVGLSQLPGDANALQKALTDAFVDPKRRDRYTDTNCKLLAQRFVSDGFSWPTITDGLLPVQQFAADMLDARMLFSALVDADFLATEGHFNGDARTPFCPRAEGPTLDFDRAIKALTAFVAEVRRRRGGDPMAATRKALHATCLAAAEQSQCLFTLSAPTGTGKTLAMLAFALHHARRHGLRRIILVMPFLNIIDQTAKIYRSIFSAENGFPQYTVLEHHSLVDRRDQKPGDANDGVQDFARLLTENWDAPIILTTTVQFFESLMADRSSRCRKLHRLARSVILFDEVQTLPLSLAVATLATLSRLADPEGPYRSTVVFATATQPAFDAFDERVRKEHLARGWQPVEMVPDAERLYAATSGRVRISWRHQTPMDLDGLAAELLQHPRVMCIVNLKRHAVHVARCLADHGAEGLLHLSTNMCPAHRALVLKCLDRRLCRASRCGSLLRSASRPASISIFP